MNKKTKSLILMACVGLVFASASPALAANGNGGSVYAIDSFNNGGASAGNGGNGNGSSGGNGGDVEAVGSFNNGGAKAGNGGSGGGVEETTYVSRFSIPKLIESRLSLRF